MPEAGQQTISRRTALIAGLIIFTLFAAGQSAWIILDQWPVSSDPVINYRFVQGFHWTLNKAPGQLLPFSNDFPPLIFLVALLFVQLFGLTADATIFSGLVFSLILYAATYLLARHWLHRAAALTAATLVLVFPVNLALSRLFFTDYAQLAFVALSLALLVDRRVFRTPARAASLGLVLGAGMLVKWTFPIFIAAPLLVRLLVPELSQRHRESPGGPDRALRLPVALVVCAAAACLVALPWYLANPQAISSRFALATQQNPSNLPGGLRLDLLYYPRMIPWMVSWPGLLLCLAGLGGMLRRQRRGVLFLFCSSVPALLIFSLMPAHWPRYLVPILPAAAVLAAAWLPATGRPRIMASTVTVAALLWAAVFSFSGASGIFFPGPERLGLDVTRPANAPQPWVTAEAVDRMLEMMAGDGEEPVCFIVPYAHHDFNCHTLRYLAVERNPETPLRFIPSFRGQLGEAPRVEGILEANWIIHKPEAVYNARAGGDPTDVRPTEGARRIVARLLDVYPRRFERRLTVPFTDGLEGALYRRLGAYEPEEIELALRTARMCGPLAEGTALRLKRMMSESATGVGHGVTSGGAR